MFIGDIQIIAMMMIVVVDHRCGGVAGHEHGTRGWWAVVELGRVDTMYIARGGGWVLVERTTGHTDIERGVAVRNIRQRVLLLLLLFTGAADGSTALGHLRLR